MATEGVALNGQHAVGEVVLLARADTANKRLGDDGRGDVEVDGFEDGPAAFAGVDYVRFKTSEGGFFSRASAVRSRSQERTTEPYCQILAIWGRLRLRASLAAKMEKP